MPNRRDLKITFIIITYNNKMLCKLTLGLEIEITEQSK